MESPFVKTTHTTYASLQIQSKTTFQQVHASVQKFKLVACFSDLGVYY